MPTNRRAICRQGDPPFNPTSESPEPSVHLGSRLMSSHSAGRPWNATSNVLTQRAKRTSQKVHRATVFEYLPLQIDRSDQTDIDEPFRLKHLEQCLDVSSRTLLNEMGERRRAFKSGHLESGQKADKSGGADQSVQSPSTLVKTFPRQASQDTERSPTKHSTRLTTLLGAAHELT